MGTILIIGRREDDLCRLMCDWLCQIGRDALFIAEQDLFPALSFTWRVPDDGTIHWNGRTLALPQLDGVISRSYGVPVNPEDYATNDGRYIAAEWHALLLAWLHRLPCPVINRLRPELWYRVQLQVPDLLSLIPNLPLKVPRMLITTRPEEARAFWENAGGQIYYHPANELTRFPIFSTADLEKLETLSATLPLRLTERIAGTPCDAFVAGERVTLVDPTGGLRPCVPDALAAACTAIGARLDLTFYRLSLVENEQGEWYCLALDRLPYFQGQSAEAQSAIVRAVAGALTAGGTGT